MISECDVVRGVPLSVRNRLLLALPTAELSGVLPLMELVTLRQGQILTEPNCGIQHIYFIETGAACVFSRGKQPVEIAMVGRFGMVGLPVALGIDKAPFRSGSAFCAGVASKRQELSFSDGRASQASRAATKIRSVQAHCGSASCRVVPFGRIPATATPNATITGGNEIPRAVTKTQSGELLLRSSASFS